MDDNYTQITWPEVRKGDLLFHENGDRLTVTERDSGVRVLVAGTEIGRMDVVWARHGFTPYRRKSEMPTQPGAYMDRDGEFWLLRDDEGGIFSTPWFSDRTEVWVTPTYAARHAPFTRLVPMPTEVAVREALFEVRFNLTTEQWNTWQFQEEANEAATDAVMALLTGEEADSE